MADERLKDFPALASPTSADLVYVADASASDNEVKVTIENFIGVYPALLSLGQLGIASDQMVYGTGTDTYATTTITSFSRSLVAAANASAAQAILGLLIGTNVQGWSAALDSISGLVTAANKMIYTTALDTYAVTDLTAVARTMLAQSSNAAILSTIGALPLAGGTMTGAINMGTFKITNLGTPVDPTDAATKAYVDSGAFLPLAGGTMGGIINMNNHKITNVTDPTVAQDAATKAYVDANVGAFLPLAGGTMAGAINMGSFKITNLLNPTNSQDAATKFYIDNALTSYLPLAGGTMSPSANINMNSGTISGLASPTNSGDAANKGYVDSVAVGLSIQAAVYAASTANLTATYANAASGIGATLTNSGAFAVFAIDGVTPPINSRILIKNQSTTFQSGIYTLTTVGDAISVNWVLTRATDYDQPSDIQPGDLVVVNNGAVNGGASFIETATVTVIGTDPILFSQFTFAASAVLLKANNLSDVSSVTAAFGNISPLTTKGDLLTYSTLNARLAVGSTNGQMLQVNSSAATGLAWSTPTYPSTSGTTGKFIISDGTNNVYSTSTIPTSAGAVANKVLLSNGTNYVLSTVTFPNAVATAGKIIISDGSNYVESTPTYPNTSVTARKILLSDGTNIIYSTETYAVPGANGNLMTSDGTNWVSSAPSIGSNPFIANCRLTLTSGLPITTSDVTGATSVFMTPTRGAQIALYNGSSTWTTLSFTEITISVPATTSTMYDVFAYNNSGVVACDAPVAWTNDTTRATALVLQDGVYVKSGATTRRYIGSFRTTGVSGQTEDSLVKRYVWNYYNRAVRPMSRVDTTNTWTYSTLAYQQANANTANQLDFVIGVTEDSVNAFVTAKATTSGSTATRNTGSGIGLDSTTVSSANTYLVGNTFASTNTVTSITWAKFDGLIAIGRHTLVWLELGAGSDTQTWVGDNGGTSQQTGISGSLMG